MTTSLAQFQATTHQLWQAWQAKTITSELIFEMVMQNPTLCTGPPRTGGGPVALGQPPTRRPQRPLGPGGPLRHLRPRRSGADLCFRDAGQR